MDILYSELHRLDKEISQIYPVHFTEHFSEKECFTIVYEKRRIHVRYSSLRVALFAAEKIYQTMKREEPLIEGEYLAKSSWRILYPKTPVDFIHVIKAGFNAVIVEDEGLEAKKFDLKILCKASFNKTLPFDPHYRTHMADFIGSLKPDFLFWESSFEDPKAHLLHHSKLKRELFLEEMSTIQELCPVFYSAPENYFSFLKLYQGENSYLIHPQSIPLVHIPAIPNTEKGAIIVLDQKWQEGSYLACHLESLGATLWGLSDFHEAIWAWLKLNQPLYTQNRHLLRALTSYFEKKQLFKELKSLEEKKTLKEIFDAEMKLLLPDSQCKFIHDMKKQLQFNLHEV